MKRLLYITLAILILPIVNIKAQQNIRYDSYIGTWKYTNSSTKEELTIMLKESSVKLPQIYGGHTIKCLAGVYIYKKNGQIILDTSNQFTDNKPANEMPISASNSSNTDPSKLVLSVRDYGKMKNGRPKTGSGLLISVSSTNPKKIRWQIGDSEGAYIAGTAPPVGFSIPTDVIFTKVE